MLVVDRVVERAKGEEVRAIHRVNHDVCRLVCTYVNTLRGVDSTLGMLELHVVDHLDFLMFLLLQYMVILL